MTLYMEVTQDEYELPLAVASSVRELARMLGKNRTTIYKMLKISNKYVRVEIPDEECDDIDRDGTQPGWDADTGRPTERVGAAGRG